MPQQNGFNAKLDSQLDQRRFLFLAWMILSNKNKLDANDYYKFDKNSIREKVINASIMSEIFWSNLIDEIVDENSLHILKYADKRKYNFISKSLRKLHGNKEIRTPPGISDSETLFAIFDSLPHHRQYKITLSEKLESDWNSNTECDELFDWYKKDFPSKKQFTIEKLNKLKIASQEINECKTATSLMNAFDTIIISPYARAKTILRIKTAYAQQKSKSKKREAKEKEGVQLKNINVEIPIEHHTKFNQIKEKLGLNQPDAMCKIIEHYYDKVIFGLL